MKSGGEERILGAIGAFLGLGLRVVRSPEHGNVIFGITYCPNSPENAIVFIITCVSLCSCGLNIINVVQCAEFYPVQLC